MNQQWVEQDERDSGFDAQTEMFAAYEWFLREQNLPDNEDAYQLFLYGDQDE